MTKREYAAYCAKVEAFFAREGLNNLSTETDEDTGENVEASFSWRPCACCGSSLGGDRYRCNGYNPTTKAVQDGYSVCQDCVYFATYGTLDDETMLGVEKDDEADDGPSWEEALSDYEDRQRWRN